MATNNFGHTQHKTLITKKQASCTSQSDTSQLRYRSWMMASLAMEMEVGDDGVAGPSLLGYYKQLLLHVPRAPHLPHAPHLHLRPHT